MAIAINFDKAKSERLLQALGKGKPISGIESVDDILALAGACFFMAMSLGPELQKAVDWSKVADEQQPNEETEDNFVPEIHAAIEYYAQLSLLVADGEYDDHFDPKHNAIVMIDRGNKTVVPVDGMRSDMLPDLED